MTDEDRISRLAEANDREWSEISGAGPYENRSDYYADCISFYQFCHPAQTEVQHD